MKKYQIKIEYETEVFAESEQEALEDFWDSQQYTQHDISTFIDENTTIEEIEWDELKEIVKEKVEKIKEVK